MLLRRASRVKQTFVRYAAFTDSQLQLVVRFKRMSPTNAGDFQAFSERQWKHLIESRH
jgi:hypothetical protein